MRLNVSKKPPAPFFFYAVLLTSLPAVGSTSAPEPFGLAGRHVTSLGVYGWLYAGTIGDGVYRRDITSPQADWVELGLPGKRIRAVYPHTSGPLGFTTSVGLEGDPPDPDSALVYCAEMDQLPWMESDDGMSRSDITSVWSLDGFPSPAICGETFAATIGPAGGVWRREFDNPQWEFVLDMGFGVGNIVRVDPVSGNVWAGGETTVLAPWIARSTDQGDTWQVAYPDLAGDNACNAIAFHPSDPEVAYAGMEGLVIKTVDGGATWGISGLSGTDAYIYGVALDTAVPSHLLAGGTILDPNSWALWESFDSGANWTVVAPLQGASATTGILAIVADPSRAGTFYIATSGDGVWKYTNVATGIGEPPHTPELVIEQNYPNPFNPNTMIRFEIPVSVDRSPARLVIYGVNGDLVRVLVDEALPAGPHRVSWNGKDTNGRVMPSGVYYASLLVGPYRQTIKISFLK